MKNRAIILSSLVFSLLVQTVFALSLTRGPYLQMPNSSAITVRWRTDTTSDSRVRYGTTLGSLNSFVDNLTVTTEHSVRVTGLLANTKYYYSVGTTSAVVAGGDANHFFVTPPLGTVVKPTHIWVIGDSGTADANATAVRDAYLNYTGSQYTDLWLMLGDNAYNSGTDAEYQSAVFNMYPSVLRQTALWPTLGNHDGISADSATQTGPYYNIFTLPKNAEAGGVSSGTEAYYSFDYSNIHFICLESYETDRSTGGAMMTWLSSDIAATNKEWVVAFWHHPPYSKGSHNSDTEVELIQMRENALPVLENAGVDLVLTGHSHSYERTFLIDNHYGLSTTFTSANKKDGGSGREDGTGSYKKGSDGPAPHEGAVYVVAGSSGQASGGSLNHPAMYISLNSLGSMVLDINGNRLDAKFLGSTGQILDYFTIVKGPPAAPTALSANAVSSSQINLAWTDKSNNEGGFRIEHSTDNITFSLLTNVGANVTTYQHTGLAPGSTHYYRVRAFNVGGSSAFSNVASDTTPTPSGLPAAPTGLNATAISKNKISLTWLDNSNNEQGFKVERSPDGVSFTQIATAGVNVKSYTNSGLKPNRTYYYRVRAYNAAGNSGYSNIDSAITPSRTPLVTRLAGSP